MFKVQAKRIFGKYYYFGLCVRQNRVYPSKIGAGNNWTYKEKYISIKYSNKWHNTFSINFFKKLHVPTLPNMYMIFLSIHRIARRSESAASVCDKCDLRLVICSATPRTAWNELYIAWNVDSSIILTELKAWTREFMDSNAGALLCDASLTNLKYHIQSI